MIHNERMEIQWTEKSRFGGLRTFVYHAEKSEIHIQYDDVMCVTYSSGKRHDEITSVDPDGGPYLGVGMTVHCGPTVYRILRIVSEKFCSKKKRLDVVLSVV